MKLLTQGPICKRVLSKAAAGCVEKEAKSRKTDTEEIDTEEKGSKVQMLNGILSNIFFIKLYRNGI